MLASTWLAGTLGLALPLAAVAQTTPASPPVHTATDRAQDTSLNQPGANWAVYGANQTNRPMTGDNVPGGRFVRAAITAKRANARDTGATSPIQKPIAAGDTILVAIYLRAPELKDGETMPLPYIGANGAGAPYVGLVGTNVAISNAWKIYYASGNAARNFAGGTMNVAVHLGSDKHVIDLGPVFVFDFGQNYTRELPRNNAR